MTPFKEEGKAYNRRKGIKDGVGEGAFFDLGGLKDRLGEKKVQFYLNEPKTEFTEMEFVWF